MEKRLITLLTVFAVLMIILTAGCVEEKPVFKVGIHEQMSPWEFVGADGNPQGIDIEVMDLIAKSQGLKAEYYVINDWETALETGVINAASGLVKTPERAELFAFTNTPFGPTRYGAIALDGSGVTLNDVLEGKATFAVMKTSSYDSWAQYRFGEEYSKMVEDGRIVLTRNMDDIALAVLSGKADAAVAADISLSQYLNYYPSLTFLGFIGEPTSAGFAMRKNDTESLNTFNEGLSRIVNTPEFDAIVEKYDIPMMSNVYIVGIDDYNNPWSYIGTDGKYTGFDIEQIEWIADKYGFELEYKVYDWNNNINAIILGDIDIWASSMTINPERKNHVAFSNPYYSSGIGVGVNPTSSLTRTDFDSEGAKIVTLYGTTYVDWLEDYYGKEKFDRKVADNSIRLIQENEKYYAVLKSGDYFCVTGEKQLEDDISKNLAKTLFVENGVEEFGIAMKKGDILLMDMINNGLEEFESYGKRAELLEKYGL